jgi:hypothetical protein
VADVERHPHAGKKPSPVDVASAEFTSKFNQVLLVGALVEDEENVDLIERIDGLDREIFGMPAPMPVIRVFFVASRRYGARSR